MEISEDWMPVVEKYWSVALKIVKSVNEVIEVADKAINNLHSVNKGLMFPKVKP